MALEAEKIGRMPDDIAVVQLKMAFPHAQVINGVEKIGLSHAVEPYKTIEPCSACYGLRMVVFKIGQYQLFELQRMGLGS